MVTEATAVFRLLSTDTTYMRVMFVTIYLLGDAKYSNKQNFTVSLLRC